MQPPATETASILILQQVFDECKAFLPISKQKTDFSVALIKKTQKGSGVNKEPQQVIEESKKPLN